MDRKLVKRRGDTKWLVERSGRMNVDGVIFGYSLDGVQLKVSSVSSGYSTTSGVQFLGSDDADILQDGDSLTLSFADVHAIGFYVISNDVLEDNDLKLTAGGDSANLLKTATQGAPLADGSIVYFLGIIDDQVNRYTHVSNSTDDLVKKAEAGTFTAETVTAWLENGPDDDGPAAG